MAENRRPPQFPSEIARRIVNMPGTLQTDPVHNEGHKKLVVGREITLAGEITDCDECRAFFQTEELVDGIDCD